MSVHATTDGIALLDEVTPHVLAAFSAEELGLGQAESVRLNQDLNALLAGLTA